MSKDQPRSKSETVNPDDDYWIVFEGNPRPLSKGMKKILADKCRNIFETHRTKREKGVEQ